MKNLRLFTIPMFGLMVLVYACQKENDGAAVTASEPGASSYATDKSGNETSLLMRAVAGEVPDFENPGELNDLLMQHLPLNDAVLNRLIANKRIPDNMVELFTILSTPVSKGVIQEIGQLRPSIDLSTIEEAQLVEVHGKQFRVINSNPIQLIVASELEHSKPYDECSSCNSVLYGSDDMRLIKLKSPSDVLNPIFKKCDSSTQECGQAMAVEKKEGGRKSRPYFELLCDRAVDVVCINGKATR